MPRKKTGPSRLTEEERRDASFNLGDQNNGASGSRGLGERSEDHGASGSQEEVDETLDEDLINLVNDLEEPISISSDEDDIEYIPSERTPQRQKNGAKNSRSKKRPGETSAKKSKKAKRELDEELQSLIDDCQFYIPVVKDLDYANQTTWSSSIGKLELQLDIPRRLDDNQQVPNYAVVLFLKMKIL